MKAEETIDQCSSGRTFQGDNWKVRPLVQIGHMKVQPGFSRIIPGSIARDSGEQFNWNFTADPLMRPEFVVPGEIEPKFIAHVVLSQRHDDFARAFGFQGADHTLDDGN